MISELERAIVLSGCRRPTPTAIAILLSAPSRPRPRMPRMVAWYTIERERGVLSSQRLIDGLRYLARGWGDVYLVSHVTRGAPPVPAGPGDETRSIEIRPGKGGSQWSTPTAFRHVPGVRQHIEVATRWLENQLSEYGCVVHTDCWKSPALSRACLAEQASRRRDSPFVRLRRRR